MKLGKIGSMLTAILVSACGNFTAEPGEVDTSDLNTLTYQAALSDCGGLDVKVELSEYCAAEIIEWDYDPDSKTLTLADNRIVLNCCGEHDMTIILKDDVYTITELDSPQIVGDVESRCHCMCSFDYEITVQDMPAEEIQVRLLRDISDNEEWNNKLVWEGTIDLTQKSGSVIIDDTPVEYGCES